MYIDTHCHLFFKDLGSHSAKTDKLLDNYRVQGVKFFLDVSLTSSSFLNQIEYSKKREDVFTGIAVHPFTMNLEENKNITPDYILSLIQNNPKIIAIGETGLDFRKNNIPQLDLESSRFVNINLDSDYAEVYFKDQLVNFENHLDIAVKTNLPIVLHIVNATNEALHLISHYIKNHNLKAILHGCGYDALDEKLIYTCRDLGLHISFLESIMINYNSYMNKIIKNIPLDKILVETDSPVKIVPYATQLNESPRVIMVYKHLANILGVELEEFKATVINNFINLFPTTKDYLLKTLSQKEGSPCS